MKLKTYGVIIVVIVVLTLIVAVFYFSSTSLNKQTQNENYTQQTPSQTQQSDQSSNSGSAIDSQNKTQEIIFTDSGFSPSSVAIKIGDTVNFVNRSSMDFWPASAKHPTHTVYSGTSLSEHCPDTTNSAFDACGSVASGSSWFFKFEKTGSWAYHDHLHSQFFGRVTVQ